jgi:hypothetical protein
MKVALAAATILSFLGFSADNVNFDTVKPGATPPGWSFVTRASERAKWEVRHDAGAPSRGNVLEKVNPQSGSPNNQKPGARGGTNGAVSNPAVAESGNSLAVFDKVVCRDGDLSVKFRIDGGARTKTTGIVWRYQDPDNYYLLHFSADQRNIVLFRVVNGKFQALPAIGGKPGAFGVPYQIRAGEWYIAKVIYRGSQIRVLFGNHRLFEVEDNGLPLPGRTGLWTRGRTTASFDDFRIDKKG